MPRRIALLCPLAVMLAAAISGVAKAKPFDDACRSNSPNASLCLGAQKLNEAAAATCRTAKGPEDACASTPAGHDVRPSALTAYQGSWVHRAALLQYELGNSVPLRDAQWLGTHNSFNTDSNGATLSHTDNNQQLTLTQQLDGDVRALELDVHQVPGPDNGLGSDIVRVCHAQTQSGVHFGCTTEPQLKDVVPEIAAWLAAHPTQVLMIYLEDNLDDAAGYRQVLDALDGTFGESIYRPDPAKVGGGCAQLPLDVTRDDMRAAGKQVFFVGNCRSGWSDDVFGWDSHRESGSTPNYRAFPACDASYGPQDYADRLIRYYEDSTWLSAFIDPSETPADHEADALTPAKVGSMIACGVNLFGFDQFDPNDGRVEASIWSLAGPTALDGDCMTMGADGRWSKGDCNRLRPAACRAANGTWTLTDSTTFGGATGACDATGTHFAAPRTGPENQALRAVAAGNEVWLNA